MDKRGAEFCVFPRLSSDGEASVVVEWEGEKADFATDDLVPFDEDAASAVADYVRAKVEREVNRDLAQARDYERTWAATRQRLGASKTQRRLFQDEWTDSPNAERCDPVCATARDEDDDGTTPPVGTPACADAICGIENEGPGRYYGTGPGATDGGGFWDLPTTIPPVIPPTPTFLGLPDVQPDDYSGNRGKMVVVNNTEDFLIFRDVPTVGGASLFTGLLDTPSNYEGNKLVAVNSTGTALEFVDKPTIPTIPPTPSFLDLPDVQPNSYTSPPAALKFVRVNGTGTGLTFSDGPIPAFKDLTDTPDDYQQGKILVSTTTGLAWTDMAGADLSVVKLATTSTAKTTSTHVSGSHPVILTVLMRVWRTHQERIAADGVTVEVVAMDQALLDLGVKAGDVFDAGQFMVYENGLEAGDWDQAFKWGVRQNPKGGWDILFRRWTPVNTGYTPGVAFPPLKEEADVTTTINHNTILQQCEFYAIVKTMDLPPHSDAPITAAPNSVQVIPIPPNHLYITFTGVPLGSYRILYTTSTAAPWIWKEFITPVVATADASGGFGHTDDIVPGRQYLAILE